MGDGMVSLGLVIGLDYAANPCMHGKCALSALCMSLDNYSPLYRLSSVIDDKQSSCRNTR